MVEKIVNVGIDGVKVRSDSVKGIGKRSVR